MHVNLLDRSFYAGDPHPAFAELRRSRPVYRDPETGMWALLLHEDVIWAEKHPDLLSSAGGSRPRSTPQPSMIDSDDPLHARRRRLVYKGFTPRRVAEYEPHVRGVVRDLLDAVAPRGAFDIVRDVAAPLPTILIAEMLGVRPADRDLLQQWSDVMLAGADGPENVTEDVLEAAAAFYAYAAEVIEERRRHPREDLISVLAHADIDGERLTHEELLAESLLILIGGNETTRHVIAGGVEAILRRPHLRRALLENSSSIPLAVEECLRWVTPIINMARTATREIQMGGETIRAGEQVLLAYISANRDERVFRDPDVFDITRDPNPHVAFGLGTHFCLGASLARLEVRVVLEELLARFPDLALADPAAPLSYTRSSFIRGITTLPVAVPARV